MMDKTTKGNHIRDGMERAKASGTHIGRPSALTGHEQYVLDRVAAGYSTKKIAEALGVAPSTVWRFLKSEGID